MTDVTGSVAPPRAEASANAAAGTDPGAPDLPLAVELIGVTKRYGDALALDDVSLRIGSGEFFCLLGPSGCGKTTTLNLIGGFIPLSSGELRIAGRTVNDLPPHKRNVNTVFQSYALFPHMTVEQNVAFGLRMSGLGNAVIRERVPAYLSLVGLDGYGARSPGQLSGGQQQRVALARALVKEPAVLLLDEPLGALDLKLRRQMQVELSRIHRQVRTTFVFVTHDQEEALSLGTRIAVMNAGHVIQEGTPREIYDRPVDRFVADFIGESNFLEGNVSRLDGRAWLQIGDGPRVLAPDDAPNGPTTLMVRPESTIVDATPAQGDAATIPGRLADVAFLGAITRLTVDTAAGRLVAERPNVHGRAVTEPELRPDEEVCVWWRASDAVVISEAR
jgi:spermidine/putrescine transport system ATP-binding protein